MSEVLTYWGLFNILPAESDTSPFVLFGSILEWPLIPLVPLTPLTFVPLTALGASYWPFVFGCSVVTKGFSRYSIIPETNPDLDSCQIQKKIR